jgi:ribosomal protein L40E
MKRIVVLVISMVVKGSKMSEEAKKKISLSLTGKKASEETRKKMSEARMGRKNTPEAIRKQVESRKAGKGYIVTPENQKKMWEASKDKLQSEESRKKRSESLKGNKNSLGRNMGPENPNWAGGVSFEPYCPKFNHDLRERVRAYFKYTCGECGTIWEEGNEKLHVHHVAFDKQICCNNKPPMFIALCRKCHQKTMHAGKEKREFWRVYYENIINTKYGGKCYYTKDEMLTLR